MKLFHAAVACTLLAAASVASAQDFKAGDIVILHPWSRATPKGANVGAGYLVVENRGTRPDPLLGGSVDVAAGFEIGGGALWIAARAGVPRAAD